MLFVILLSVVGSFVNIPIRKGRLVLLEQPYFFGLFKKSFMASQGISINVGGAVIPLLVSLYFLLKVPLKETLFAILYMTLIAYIFAKFIPEKGVVLPPFPVAILAAIVALILAPQNASYVAFIAGSLGVLLGADILNIPRILRSHKIGILSVGGAGVFDGIFLTGIISALLAYA